MIFSLALIIIAVVIFVFVYVHDWLEGKERRRIENKNRRDFKAERERLDAMTAARLSCGARVLKLDDMEAEVYSLWVDNGDDELFRQGDLVVKCRHDCPCFEVCPLVKRILAAGGKDDLERITAGLLARGRLVDGKYRLPGVDDSQLRRPVGQSVRPTVKAFVVHDQRGEHIIVPPMLLEVSDGDDGGNGRGDSGQGQYDIADV